MEGSILQLGRDHTIWGEYSLDTRGGGRTAVAISVGSDTNSPGMSSKGSRHQPNEDAALAYDEGQRTLIAVADSHHGIDASHELLRAIDAMGMPDNFEDLLARLGSLSPLRGLDESSTTLVVSVLDRETGSGFGISFGDSSLVRIGPDGAWVINVRRAQFVNLRSRGGLDPEFGHAFHFFVSPGELLAAFTDGISECHYRSPETSIGNGHLAQVFESTRARPESFAKELMELALSGVDGNPGGQDNIALVVTATDPEPGS